LNRFWLKLIFAVSVLSLLALAGSYAWVHHSSLFRYNLKLATGPVGTDGQKLLAAFIRELGAERPLVRLIPVETEDLSANGKALLKGDVDLAVVRSDDEAAMKGRTLFILRQVGVAILLPPDSEIESASALVGKKLAVTKTSQFDPGLLKTLVEFYGLREADLIEMSASQLGSALKSKRVAAAVVFGQLGPGPITDAFANIRKGFKEPPTFLDIGEAEAIAAKSPAFDAVEIKQGTFGGAPPEPTEAINTFAVSVRLVSRASMPNRVAGEITRMLLATKVKLATTLPVVAQMQAPDTDKTVALPVHPGTLAFLNGEQQSLLDETLQYYWYAGMVLSMLAPVAGWITAKARLRRRDEAREKLFRLVELMRLAKVGTAQELAGANEELHGMMEWLFARLAAGLIERDHFQCVEGMISQLRVAIEKRLADLAAGRETKTVLAPLLASEKG
jgi:TRAP transporter TAXI family solute receptor